MTRLLLAFSVTLVAACATPKPAEKMSAEEAFGPAQSSKIDPVKSKDTLGTPKEWAKQWRRDLECERGARDLDPVYGHDTAWKYLKGCVAQGGFTQLKTLIDNWTEDLKTRPEASSILAQVVAARGGHLRSDVEILQQARIPLFELGAALKQSSAFKGRYLLVVGKISETKEVKGRTELVVMEHAISSEASSVMSGPRYGSTSSSSASGSYSTSKYGSGKGEYSANRKAEYGKVETRVTDYFEETGQEIIAKIKQPDPFIRIDKNLVLLVRFDGTAVADTENTAEGEEPRKTALVTLISYHDL